MNERRDMSLVKNQLLLQDITRWHIVPTVMRQTVADHTYGVMVIVLKICSLIPVLRLNAANLIDPFNALLEAMTHDFGEIGFGDIPDGGKPDRQKQAEWNAMDPVHRIVRLADVLERLFTMERLAPTARGEFIAKYASTEVELLLTEGVFDKTDIPDEFERYRINTEITKGIHEMIAEKWDWSVGR